MRYLLALALLLAASPAHAGPSAKRLLSVMRGYAYVTSINGVSSISESGTTDTGTQTLTMTANPTTAAASCSSGVPGVQVDVSLVVDGTIRDSITCDNSSTSKTLTYTTTAGIHDVQFVGTTDDLATGLFTVNSFHVAGTP